VNRAFDKLGIKARRRRKTIILPESYDRRVIESVRMILSEGLASIILISIGKKLPLEDSKNLTIIDLNFSSQFASQYRDLVVKRHAFSLQEAERQLRDPLTFACMLLRNNFADAVVAGSVYPTSEVIRNGIRIIGLSSGNKTVSSFFLFTFPEEHRFRNRVFAYADCGVIASPTAKQMSEIAYQTCLNFHKLTGGTPKVAFLSFSTKGSAKDDSLKKIIAAYNLFKSRHRNVTCDGELQFDAAFKPEVAKRKNPGGAIKGDANVFIFPDLNAGNIAYKITERIGGAYATGPILQGFSKPVMDLSRGCSTDDIYKMILVAANW
jgi:phosphate acetyltransferase